MTAHSHLRRAETAIKLQSLADRGTAASSGSSAPFCTDCDQRGREVPLTRLIAGWWCSHCKRVSVDVVGSASGIQARWGQP